MRKLHAGRLSLRRMSSSILLLRQYGWLTIVGLPNGEAIPAMFIDAHPACVSLHYESEVDEFLCRAIAPTILFISDPDWLSVTEELSQLP